MTACGHCKVPSHCQWDIDVVKACCYVADCMGESPDYIGGRGLSDLSEHKYISGWVGIDTVVLDD